MANEPSFLTIDCVTGNGVRLLAALRTVWNLCIQVCTAPALLVLLAVRLGGGNGLHGLGM